MSNSKRDHADSPASIFERYLERVDAEDQVDFEDFRAEYPSQSEALERLKRRWEALRSLRRRALSRNLDRPAQLETFEESNSRLSPISEIGRGGMGTVYRVWDAALSRTLAMKVSRRTMDNVVGAVDPTELERFRREARITAQLDHPGVIPIHEMGVGPKGEAYFTMRLVRGHTLADVFELMHRGSGDWNQARVLNVLLRVCEAIDFAHHKGIVHRDLKPANVMVGRFGEVYVMDWGLADARSERPDEAIATPLSSEIVGTPAYMSPEQARGERSATDARTDVYALGAMLYHALTGVVPYAVQGVAPSSREVLEAVRKGPPPPIERLKRGVPDELIAIVGKAMSREPLDRYASSAEFAADLRAYLEGRVVNAHGGGPWRELSKWVARNRSLALALLGAIAILVLGLIATRTQYVRAEAIAAEAIRQRDAAVDARQLSELQRQFALEGLGLSSQMIEMLDAHRLGANLVEELRAQMERHDDLESAFDLEDQRRWLGQVDGVGLLQRLVNDWLLANTRSMLDSIETLPARAHALGMASSFLATTDQFPEAIESLRESIAILETDGLQGGEYVEDARLRLSRLLSDVGLSDEARAIAAAERDRTQFLARAPDRLRVRVLAQSAWAECQILNWDAAVNHLEVAADLANRSDRIDEATRASVDADLGVALFKAGRLLDAERVLRRAITREKCVYDEAVAARRGSRRMLAIVLKYRGSPHEAEQVLKALITTLETHFGPYDDQLVTAIGDLAGVYEELGDNAEAERCLRVAVDRARHSPRFDPGLASILKNALGRHDFMNGRVHESLTALREHIALRFESPAVLFDKVDGASGRYGDLVNLGVVLASLGCREEAEQTLRDALVGLDRTRASDFPWVMNAQVLLAQLVSTTDPLEAEYLLRESWWAMEYTMGDARAWAPPCLVHLGSLLRDQGRIPEAVAEFERLVELQRSSYGDSHIRVASAMGRVADALAQDHELHDEEFRLRVELERRFDEEGMRLSMLTRSANLGALITLCDRFEERGVDTPWKDQRARWVQLRRSLQD